MTGRKRIPRFTWRDWESGFAEMFTVALAVCPDAKAPDRVQVWRTPKTLTVVARFKSPNGLAVRATYRATFGAKA